MSKQEQIDKINRDLKQMETDEISTNMLDCLVNLRLPKDKQVPKGQLKQKYKEYLLGKLNDLKTT